MDKDDNSRFFSSRPNTRDTLRQYESHRRRNRPRHKQPALDNDRDAPPRPGNRGPDRDSAKPAARAGQRSRGRPRSLRLPRFAFPAIVVAGARITGVAVVAVCLLVVGVAAFGLWMTTGDNALEVFVGGESVGFIAERDTTAEDLAAQVETAISVTIGTNVVLDQEITLEAARAPSPSDVLHRPDIIPIIRDNVTFRAEGFVIQVDGAELGLLRNREAAEGVLSGIIQRNMPDGVEIVGQPAFAEDVTIQSRFMSEDAFESAEVVIARLNQERPVSHTYTVQSGDNMSMIASNFGMSLEEIFEANPAINPANPALSIGQIVNVVQMTPTLSVSTVEVSVTNEEVPYGTDTISNPTHQNTFRAVRQQGHTGVMEVTRHITRINGVIVGSEIISENILQEPVNELVEVGTRN